MFYSSKHWIYRSNFFHVCRLLLDSVVCGSTGQITNFQKYNFMNKYNLTGFEYYTGNKYINSGYFTTGGVGDFNVYFISFISFHFSCD
jgi:hypothetical protein